MTFPTGRRAQSLEELRAIRARFDPSESRRAGLRYTPAPSDVFIATYPKCGTTWLQQMMHTLRTGGDSDFGEITEVVPWLEMAALMGLSPDHPQRAEPKVFKTHLRYEDMPKGGRYVHMVRDPADVAVSLYHFHEGWFFEPNSIQLDEFVEQYFLPGARAGTYWDFVASWWPLRDDPNVLTLAYEEALAAPRAAIERVAAFMGIDADAHLLDLTLTRSGIGYMREHGKQFDDHVIRDLINAGCSLPADSGSTKVRAGRSGEGSDRLGAAVRDALDAAWRNTLGQRFKLASYAELRQQIGAP